MSNGMKATFKNLSPGRNVCEAGKRKVLQDSTSNRWLCNGEQLQLRDTVHQWKPTKFLVGDCFLPLMFSIMCEILSPITFKLLCSRGIWSQCQSVKSKKPPHILAFSRPSSLDLPPCWWVITILIERIDRTYNDSQETDVKSSRSKFRKPSSSSAT